MEYLDSVSGKRKEQQEQRQKEFLHKQGLAQSKESAKQIVDAINTEADNVREVKVTNDVATKSDINSVISQLKENQLAQLMGNNKPSLILASGVDVEDILEPLAEKIDAALNTLANNNKDEKVAKALDKSFSDFAKSMSLYMVKGTDESRKTSQDIQDAISSLDLRPVVNVPAPKVNVQSNPTIDLSALENKLDELKTAIQSIPSPILDQTDLMSTMDNVRVAIESLRFPVPNYVLPYETTDGAATQVTLTSAGRIPVELGISPTIDIGDVQVKDAGGTVINPSTKENQTTGAQKTQITDSSGTANTLRAINTDLVGTDIGIVTNSIMHGLTTGGGGGYVDVKVNPSGALTVENTPATSGTGTVTTASVTTSNTTVLASNTSRKGATIYNEGTVTALVKLGSTASATSYTVKILQDGYYEVPFGYTGIVTGITASGTATCRVSELT